MAKMTSTKVDETDVIDNHQKFQSALIKAQANIINEPHPILEVAPEFMQAISAGHDVESMTMGRPAVRVFKVGESDRILREESLPAEEFYNIEIKRKSEAARK
jgi:hypothetical protein